MSERIRQLERYVAELVRRVEESERRLTNLVRPGRVAQVDAQKGLVKLAYAKDENGVDVVSPWLRWRVTLTKPVRLGVRNFLRPSAERILVDDATLELLKAEDAIGSCGEFRPAVQA